MKKLLLLLLFIPVLAFSRFDSQPMPSISSPDPVVVTSALPNVLGEKIAEPKRLVIPRLDVETTIEHVGADSEGRMDVPENNANVAWWEPGTIPGEMGSAVLAGHFDNEDGSPSVFYDLEKLEKGDTVIVLDEDGGELEFEVVDKKYFKDADFPISVVFEQDDKKRLNLITCAGVFNKDVDKYEDRLVVFTEKVQSS